MTKIKALSNSRLTFIKDTGRNQHMHKLGLFRCECGNEKIILINNVARGKTISCGCFRKEATAKNKPGFRHGLAKTPIYDVWHLMMRRCYEVGSKNYHQYGGRGVKVCEEWHDVKVFSDWAFANGWQKGLQTDRYPNMDGNYEPLNCRFVTSKVNNNNRRNNVYITAFGKTQTLQQWADETGIYRKTIQYRIKELKLMPEQALINECPQQ